MLSHVLRTITRHGLLVGNPPPGVLCAVSGGPDSMALLACLWELAPRLRLRLQVTTVDHGLRPEAATEMALVAQRCADLGLPWHPLRVDVKAARQPRSGGGDGSGGVAERGGIQEVARRLRLAALAELATRLDCAAIALGHTADDQAETVLFRILRGTGVKGLAGIPYRRPPFVRPLLDVTRAQILNYLARRSVPYVTDPSNADLRYARSRLRHQILPLLRRENPRVDRALRALASQASSLSPSVERQRPVWFDDALASTGHIPEQVMAQIEGAARDGNGTRSFDLAGGRQIIVSYGHVSVVPAVTRPAVARPPGAQPTGAHVLHADARFSGIPPMGAGMTMVHGAGTYPTPLGWNVVVCEQVLPLPLLSGPRGVEGADGVQWSWFDGDQLSWPLTIRARRPGDRMSPRGGVGSRKLSDLLIDAKVPRPERGSLPVVTAADGELVFVPGLRPSRTAVPSPETSRRIGLAVVPKTDHDALVDRWIVKGNNRIRPYQGRGSVEPGGENQGAAETSDDKRTSGCAGGTPRFDGRDR